MHYYCKCGKPATWILRTSTAKQGYFCTEHTQTENHHPSDARWVCIRPDQVAPPHPIEVTGYEGELQLLCQQILRMRYDKVCDFFRFASYELIEQAHGDQTNGRIQLATKLKKAAKTAELLQRQLSSIWKLCEPHMK